MEYTVHIAWHAHRTMKQVAHIEQAAPQVLCSCIHTLSCRDLKSVCHSADMEMNRGTKAHYRASLSREAKAGGVKPGLRQRAQHFAGNCRETSVSGHCGNPGPSLGPGEQAP